jgi:hypothetical protein
MPQHPRDARTVCEVGGTGALHWGFRRFIEELRRTAHQVI